MPSPTSVVPQSAYMSTPFVFVSCGQFTEAEKRLGKSIAKIVKSVTGIDAYFAEEVQDLNGLDSNILEALRKAVGFITVLHPRGTIRRPDGSEHVRASVWIEQEIAIATYIQRTEERSLPIIAFVHESVGREGLRDLLHLNPIPFSDELEVLAAMPDRLQLWKNLSPTGISISLHTEAPVLQQGHPTRRLLLTLNNKTNTRITNWNGRLRLPTGVLKHWATHYAGEEPSADPQFRIFRLDEEGRGPIPPHRPAVVAMIDYCVKCAAEYTGDSEPMASAIVSEYTVDAQVWIAGREYKTTKTIKELSQQAR